MARRNSETPAETPEVEASNTPEAEVTETPAAETPIDLTAFQAATESAVSVKDSATGEVPAEQLTKVQEAYRALDGIKPKNAAKSWVEDQIKTAIMPPNLDAVTARAYSMVKDSLTAGSASKADKAPADPTAAYVQKVASLQLALTAVQSGAPEVEGLDEKVSALVTESTEGLQAQLAWLANEAEDKGDQPEASPVVRTALKLAQGKASGGSRQSGGSGVRRSIEKHVAEYFADKEPGHFATVAEIANHKSAEYGDEAPSQGAVSARLSFGDPSKCTVPGITPVPAGHVEGKPRGAVKNAA